MKNKKGFTLIELLAVIVILAVIMVIAVPQILNVIEKSKESAASSSIKLVKDAIRSQVTSESMMGTNFTSDESGCYTFNFDNQTNGNAKELQLKNKENITGTIKYCNGKFESDTLTFDGTSVSGGETTPAVETVLYEFGTPTASSTTDWTTLGKIVFATLTYGETTGGVCINDGGLFCIKANDYENSQELLKAHFGESKCFANESSSSCISGDFTCFALASGHVRCLNNSAREDCYAYADGRFYCGW